MEKLREGLWRWTVPHPAWDPEEDWDEQVSCLAHASSEGLVLVDPLVELGDWTALDELVDREGAVVAVAVTAPFHERHAAEASRRYGAALFAPPLDRDRPALADAREIGDGERLPGGVEAIVVPEGPEALLYLSGARTLVAGDLLVARDGRLSLCPVSWLQREQDLGPVRRRIARALELPLEAVAVSHGEPPLFEGRAALEDALRA